MILGILDGYVGLNVLMFTQIYAVVYWDNSTSLIILAMWLPMLSFIIIYAHSGGKGS
jgi:hypothetical protein